MSGVSTEVFQVLLGWSPVAMGLSYLTMTGTERL